MISKTAKVHMNDSFYSNNQEIMIWAVGKDPRVAVILAKEGVEMEE
jgi:hypothetical protein